MTGPDPLRASPPRPAGASTLDGLTALAFEDSLVRIIVRAGEPWFVLGDVCRVLGLTTPAKSAARLDDDEKGVTTVHTLGGPQEVTILSESGLYALILTSRKPAAKRFRKWVTAEVLPEIRRRGRYEAPGAAAAAADGPTLTERQTRLALDQVQEIRLLFGIPAARAAWARLGLAQVDAADWKPGDGPMPAAPTGDVVLDFARTALVVTGDPADRLTLAALADGFRVWCRARGRAGINAAAFARRLPSIARLLGFEKGKASVSCYGGIRWAPDYLASPGPSLI